MYSKSRTSPCRGCGVALVAAFLFAAGGAPPVHAGAPMRSVLATEAATDILSLDALDEIRDHALRRNLPGLLLELLTFSPNVSGIYRTPGWQTITLSDADNAEAARFAQDAPFKTYAELSGALQAVLGDALNAQLVTLSGVLTALAIAQTSPYGFGAAVNVQAAQAMLQGIRLDEIATALYGLLFPYLAHDDTGIWFSDYLASGPEDWAIRYMRLAESPAFIDKLEVERSLGTPDWALDTRLITYKLNQLFPPTAGRVRMVYLMKDLPVYDGRWTDLVPPGALTGESLVGGVLAAIARQQNQQSVQFVPLGLPAYYKVCLTRHGPDVADFLNGWGRQAGITRPGASFDNVNEWRPDLFFECGT